MQFCYKTCGNLSYKVVVYLVTDFTSSCHCIAKHVVLVCDLPSETDVRKGFLIKLLLRKFLGGVGEICPGHWNTYMHYVWSGPQGLSRVSRWSLSVQTFPFGFLCVLWNILPPNQSLQMEFNIQMTFLDSLWVLGKLQLLV